ncbi:Alpha/Beta hydrolase protein [Desarmillaria tabescens]|uniref:Alpha/Beta hydrolase protein n=1 Tax=Armillaria tabescens TaxID=1929756 RepID=A0AA39NMN7_ARMTA|nr:Alpha/Beta hydrolase protein [Desarmillaria tabescens]KAK0468466.1 Alpha/Beta hydrolase protein [Desarmillaria tabescens]
MSNVHIREHETSALPRAKPSPKSSRISVPFFYCPSDDGTDENLLILLHGLGDTHKPFSNLGRQLKLPQTAILALRAPDQIPYLYEEAFQWYDSFDPLGELIRYPNPTPALDLMKQVLRHLVEDCAWREDRLHLFGFAQGGSVAAEFGLRWWKEQKRKFGSIVSVGGPLLSYPTIEELSPTPILVVHRASPAEPSLPRDAMVALRRAYQSVGDEKLDGRRSGMPSSKDEWEPIMRFWSEKLSKRQIDGLYEVTSGIAPPS